MVTDKIVVLTTCNSEEQAARLARHVIEQRVAACVNILPGARSFYRWKDEAEQGAKAALGGRSAAAAETEKDHRIRQLERTLGRKALEIEILKNVVGE